MLQRPDILLVLFDSLSPNDVGAQADHLPTLSALRAKCVCFEKAFACSPESGPSRASLFTGLDMAAHGVRTDGIPLPERETTLPEVFRRNGYHTWLVGRRHLAAVANWTTEHARPQEYHHFDWAHGPLHRSRQNAYLNWLVTQAPDIYASVFPSQPNPDDTHIPAGQRQALADLPEALSFNNWVGAQVATRLAAGSKAPFLGIASFVVGATAGARDEASDCFECVDEKALVQADEALGGVLAALSKDTIVALCAGRGTNRSTHVPLWLQMPGRPASQITEIVSTMDVAPTLYDAASIVAPQRLQGQNLLTDPHRNWALSRLRHPDLPQETYLQTDRWKVVMTKKAKQPAFQLFDLQTDPEATQDIANRPDHADMLENMIDLLLDARVALEDRTEPRIASF